MLQGPNRDIEYSPDYRSAKWRNSSWNNGNIPDMNVKDPPLKDTVVIPYKGYVVLRLKTENPGIFSTLEPYNYIFLPAYFSHENYFENVRYIFNISFKKSETVFFLIDKWLL